MKRTPFATPASHRGFTLIELLVVIAIIALLVTGAFGAYGFVMEKAKKSDAQAACMAVSNGVDQYHTEYDYLPQPTSATKGTDCVSDTGPEEGLILILLAMDVTQNAKKINFIGDIKEAKSQSGAKVSGLVRTEETAELFDPWSNHYKVVLDLDLDEKILNPNDKDAASGRTELHKQVIVYSPGKDKDEKEWKDNIGSWEFPKE